MHILVSAVAEVSPPRSSCDILRPGVDWSFIDGIGSSFDAEVETAGG